MTPTPPAAARLTDEEVAEVLRAHEPLCWRIAGDVAYWQGPDVVAEVAAEVRAQLAEAARRFDPSRGVKFITYAHRLAKSRAMSFAGLQARRGLHVPEGHLRGPGRAAAPRVGSIDGSAAESGDPLTDILVEPAPEEPCETPPDFWERVERVLTPKQYAVIRMRFVEGVTLAAAGERLGCVKERVRQHQARALERLAEFLPGFRDYLT